MAHTELASNPQLLIALALLLGVGATVIARHFQMPAIVLLLGMGVLAGPDVLGMVHPNALGSGLRSLVGFAVAVILFEGALNLQVHRLRGEQRAIRQLITFGSVVTMVGGALAAHFILGWEWRVSLLFGTLVIVTGPTVITPLLRRLRVERSVGTILEAEGILIDAVGAVVAIVALEVALSPSGLTIAKGIVGVAARLVVGAVLGTAAGVLLGLLLKVRKLVTDGLENVFTLAWVLALFQLSNAILPESGIVSVTVCGLVLGNMRTHVGRELREFKEQLTAMLIGMLFVLLAADIRLAEVRALGWAGLVVVAVLMFVVRPLNVLAGTFRTNLDHRQRIFVAWIAPRGIVAAAVTAFFASELDRYGLPGGAQLRALVFLVIACTVIWSGLTGGVMARLLGLRRPTDRGWIVLGASELGRALARALKDGGEEVVCIDTNADAVEAAVDDRLTAVEGNGLDEQVLEGVDVDARAGVVALTPNDEVNVLFVRRVKERARLRRLYAAIRPQGAEAEKPILDELGAEVLFGGPEDVALWSVRLRGDEAAVDRWRFGKDATSEKRPLGEAPEGLVLPLVYRQGSTVRPVAATTRFRRGDELVLLVSRERFGEVEVLRGGLGAERVDAPGLVTAAQAAATRAGG